MKTPKIHLADFTFTFAGHGHYKVTYQSPVTQKTWTQTTSNMELIDCTKNCDTIPKRKDLEELKRIVK